LTKASQAHSPQKPVLNLLNIVHALSSTFQIGESSSSQKFNKLNLELLGAGKRSDVLAYLD
jgi:hypothetical protein